jgi:hypothetical protein
MTAISGAFAAALILRAVAGSTPAINPLFTLVANWINVVFT